jgi:DNA-binding NarL/FixJ family response regulator
VIRILIADDHSIVRTGLTVLLSAEDDFEVIGSASNGAEVVAMAKADPPDIVLVDLAMPTMDGVTATELLKQLFPQLPVIVLTTFHDPATVKRALASGANGYVLKDIEPEALAWFIRSAIEGGVPLSPRVAAQLLRAGPADDANGTLTPRELQILHHIAAGHSNKQIARLLGISELTVKSHCGRLFQRLGVTDRTQAAVWATKHSEADQLPSP